LKPSESKTGYRASARIALCLIAILACTLLPAANYEGFYFTVTSDLHDGYARFSSVCDAINRLLGGPGAFHVSSGDLAGSIRKNREIIDQYFGKTALWFPVAGNHDMENGAAIEWLRNEYANGNSARVPLRTRIINKGPAGTESTTYSWDYGGAHFVVLNIFWNGESKEGTGRRKGSDTAGKGDIVPALWRWLDTDLAACDKPFIFVFGHEPAFPIARHVGSSLDANKGDRDAFWRLLEAHDVTAYICGHTHYYSAHRGNADHAGNVWQFCAGSGGTKSLDGLTFLQFVVGGNAASLNVYRDSGGKFSKTAVFNFAPRKKAN